MVVDVAAAELAREWIRPLGLRRVAQDLGVSNAATIDWASQRRADAAELLAIGAICRDTGRLAGDLGRLPLAVVTSSEFDPGYELGGKRAQVRSRMYPGWRVLQDELATLSSTSTYVVAEYGGHHLNRDNPELVAQVLVDLVQRVRSQERHGSAS
jgi:hypothetical protein